MWTSTPALLSIGAAVLFLCALLLRLTGPRGNAMPGNEGGERLLFVAATSLAVSLVREIEARPHLRWRVLGVLANPSEQPDVPIGPWLGPVSQLPEVIAATCPTRIIVARATRRHREAEQTLLDAHMAGIAVQDAGEVLEKVTGKMPIERLTSRTLVFGGGFTHSDLGSADSTQWMARLISATSAAIGLILCAPLFALIAIAIKLDSGGPVLFSQERLGMNGRSFVLHKFRTMRESRARTSEWVSDNSHRITRVGRWLRRFRADELPQLVNVLVGHMNLVGPRPHPSCNGPLFMARIPHYRLRASVRPGITGWAQVRYGYANGLDEETEKMRYDLYYIKHRSLLLDLQILIATVAVLVDGRTHEHVTTEPLGTWIDQWRSPREHGLL